MFNAAAPASLDDSTPDLSDDGILAAAKARLQLCVDADDANRALGQDDLIFLDNEDNAQWDAVARRQREIDGRPCLTTNTLPAILHQVTNDNRQNRQSIHVHPVDSGADVETAAVIEGLIRHIEYDSNADTAYDTAVGSAAAIGFGFFRLVSEYESPTSFDQVLKIKRVRNPFSVYLDPAAQELDGSDARFAVITTKMSKAEFKATYPQAEITLESIGKGVGDTNTNWIWSDQCRVAEYYTIEDRPATLCLYSDGTVAEKGKGAVPLGVTVLKERKSLLPRVMWYKITAFEVLERAEIPGAWIPVFPVWGDEIDINGQVKRSGLIRHAKDPMRMANYWQTAATEEVAMRTKTPYIGAVGQFEGMEAEWASANQQAFSYLEYNPVSIEGTLAPAPQRQPMADVPVGALAMLAHARDNIKAVTGIYDASLGARGNETSGKGIMARQRQGDVANFHYADNLSRAIRHLGRVIVGWIPSIYDTQRVLRVLGVDDKADTVEINAPVQNPKPDPKTGAVKTVLNDLTVGRYDVVVASGPSYSTLRQEAADGMIAATTAEPALWQVIGDKVIAAMDWPGAEEMAERVKRTIPPQILGPDGEEDENVVQTAKGPIPAHQAGQLIDQMDQATAKMHEELTERDVDIQKAQIAAETAIRVAEINAQASHDKTELTGMIQLLIAGQEAQEARAVAAQSAADAQLAADAQRQHEAEQAAQAKADEAANAEPVEPEPEKPDPVAEHLAALRDHMKSSTEAAHALMQQLAKPKTVVRDKGGRVVGVQ